MNELDFHPRGAPRKEKAYDLNVPRAESEHDEEAYGPIYRVDQQCEAPDSADTHLDT